MTDFYYPSDMRLNFFLGFRNIPSNVRRIISNNDGRGGYTWLLSLAPKDFWVPPPIAK
jgi:hypothetical protein